MLGWCQSRGIEHLTVNVLSADNIAKPEREIGRIRALLESVVVDAVTSTRRPWGVHLSGDPTLLPYNGPR